VKSLPDDVERRAWKNDVHFVAGRAWSTAVWNDEEVGEGL
jgi:hypothetical protein